MVGLPFLPGYTIQDPSKCQFNVPQTLDWRNGYAVVKKPNTGIGGQPLVTQGVLHSRSVDAIRYDPSLTYGRTKNYVPPKFLPHFLLYSNKCLTFKAFFKQSVVESPDENYRVRIVNIIYFLEDDTITVMEPKVENAGFPQGRIVKRGRIPKNDLGDFWHWKDLNVGMDMEIYGIVYHVCSCDQYTRETVAIGFMSNEYPWRALSYSVMSLSVLKYKDCQKMVYSLDRGTRHEISDDCLHRQAWLESQGVELGLEEELPFDPYTLRRQILLAPRQSATIRSSDKFKKFIENDKSVLRFYAIWDDRLSEYGEIGKYTIHYYLVDDTMDIIKQPTKDQISLFQSNAILKKTKVPRNWEEIPVDFCPLVQERTDEEFPGFYTPEDLICGKTVFLMGRRFYLYDCDEYTRQYYRKYYCIEQPKIQLPEPPKREPKKQPIPPYTGFGTHEDSMLSYHHLDPLSVKSTNKMDFIRYVQNTNKKLRYTAVMDYVHPEDAERQFLIEYRISDGTVMIHEFRQRNSGFKGGRFLKPTLVPKPGTNPDNPEYYTPIDFRIGAVVEVYGHRFRITGVDLAVYRYMEANPEKFDQQMLTEVRRHLTREGFLTEDIKDVAEFRRREEIAEPVMELPEEEKKTRSNVLDLKHLEQEKRVSFQEKQD